MADTKIVIGGDSSGAKKAFSDVENSASKLKETVALGAAAAAAAFTAFTAVVVKGVAAYREQEIAVNGLNQALVKQGIFTKELSQDYQNQASELQALTTFGDEAILQAQTRIQAFIGEEKVTRELTLATLDYAQATGKDVVAAAEAVAKTIGTQTNVLARSGIEIDTTASKTEKLAEVTQQLNARFGGQAAAAAQGLGGIKQLQNTIGDLFELVGQDVAPILGVLIGQLSQVANAFGNASKETTVFGDTIGTAASFISNFFAALQDIVAVATGSITTLVTSLSAVFEGEFTKALDIVKNAGSNISAELTSIAEANNERQTQFANARLAAQEAEAARELQLLQQSEANKFDVRARADEEELVRRNEQELLKQEEDLLKAELQLLSEEQKIAGQIAFIDRQLGIETDAAKRSELIAQRSALVKKKIQEDAAKAAIDLQTKTQQSQIDLLTSFGNLANAIGGKASKAGFLIQKGAAIAGSIVATRLAVAKALASAPPPANAAIAATTELAGNINTAAIIATAITGFADGGIATGGRRGVDSIPAFLQPGELVVPTQSFEEVITATADRRIQNQQGGAGVMEVIIGFRDQAFEIIEQKLIERRAEGVGLI